MLQCVIRIARVGVQHKALASVTQSVNQDIR